MRVGLVGGRVWKVMIWTVAVVVENGEGLKSDRAVCEGEADFSPE